ncbi:MAG: sensor histidine kinase, partial [Desulfonatronovibrionaceae bacterium]
LAPLLQELVEEFRQSHSDIRWELEFKSTVPGFNFDREALKRAFMNLLLNAAEELSRSKSQGEIHIRVFHDRPVQKVSVEIMDNGPGLSFEERSRVFEPYYSRKKIGTGLGLTIVKSIISDHHGYVRVKANDPQGSIFVVELPIAA